MITSKKKLRETIEELERQRGLDAERILDLNNQIKSLHKKIDSLYDELDECTKLKDGTPEDCTLGGYCQACHFGKRFLVSRNYGFKTVYFCGKGESCSNFVQVEVKGKEHG